MKVGRRRAQDGTTRERSVLVGVSLAAAAASPEDYWGEEGREHYAWLWMNGSERHNKSIIKLLCHT